MSDNYLFLFSFQTQHIFVSELSNPKNLEGERALALINEVGLKIAALNDAANDNDSEICAEGIAA